MRGGQSSRRAQSVPRARFKEVLSQNCLAAGLNGDVGGDIVRKNIGPCSYLRPGILPGVLPS